MVGWKAASWSVLLTFELLLLIGVILKCGNGKKPGSRGRPQNSASLTTEMGKVNDGTRSQTPVPPVGIVEKISTVV